MQPSADELRQRYKLMDTEDLLELASRGTLTEVAQSLAEEELTSRGRVHPEAIADPQQQSLAEEELTSRGVTSPPTIRRHTEGNPSPTIEELRAFTHEENPLEHYEYYSIKWQGLQAGTSRWAGFNFAAFFFPMTWCFYRKMYWLGILPFLPSFLAYFF